MKNLAVFLCVLSVCGVSFSEELGWTVAIDPTSKVVIERSYGIIVMSHRPLTVSGVPSIVIEQNPKYLAWHDLNLDGVPQSNEIEPMTQAEKDAFDAPILAEQARQQAFTDEISGTTGNDICNAELSVIASKLDTLKAANQADIDAITNVASAKVALTNMNNRYDLVLRRIARCLRARSR